MSFDSKQFLEQLINEVLFYDEEYGAIGNLSLIDDDEARERYIAFYSPQDQSYIIEEAVEWEPMDPEEDADIGYEFASETNSYLISADPEEIAKALMKLAEEDVLYPSISLSFEDDDIL